ncbi:MAG: phytanoyl-CoA dioxygenase family protein [Planctomycetia bacterium]|nr:phytanoyl-CoA dioxygenase family protein [Planctomycetia bacterium]
MELDAIAESFHTSGWVVMHEMFSAADVREIKAQLARYRSEVVGGLDAGEVYFERDRAGELKALHGMERHSSFFSALRHDPRLLRIVGAIWPAGSIVAESVMFFGKPPRGAEAPAHQDNAFLCLEPPDALTATIAIDASSRENGALTCRAGSHRLGLLAHRQSGVLGFSRTLDEPIGVDRFPAVMLEMQPGDVALHHCNTIHWSGPNETARARRQVGIGYRSSLATRDGCAWATYQDDLRTLHSARGSHK